MEILIGFIANDTYFKLAKLLGSQSGHCNRYSQC